MNARAIVTTDTLPASINADPWHIVHREDDMVALCGHVLRGETATVEPAEDETCLACLVLNEIPCGCGDCS